MSASQWRTLDPRDVVRACGSGAGYTIGLPTVSEEQLPAVLAFAAAHPISVFEDAKTLAVAREYSDECDQDRSEMTDEWLVLHTWTSAGKLLIDCEGFHTALLRVIRNNMLLGGLL